TDQSSAAYSPLPATTMTPTSNRSEPRVYGNEASDGAAYPVPKGANPQDWALGQRIREMLSTNIDLSASPVAVVVHGSTVILHGSVPTQSERRKVKAAIAAVPGVQQVQDEMQIKNPAGHFNDGESKSY
ncbi:MAG: BON domain-containing protein, partial [Limisphaerales bacterium]